MIVRIHRRGGLAGFDDELAVLDTSRLAPEAEGRVQARLAEIERLAAAEERLGADQLRFEIDVEGDARGPLRLVAVDQGEPQDPLMREVEGLLGEAEARRTQGG